MFIKEIKITNFKCFGNTKNQLRFNIPDGKTEGSGLNILVGNNNTGKSTIFESIFFLRNGSQKDIETIKNLNASKKSSFKVELTFSGNLNGTINQFAQQNKKQVIKKYIFNINNKESIKLRRSFNNKKDSRSISLWDNKTHKYKNASGIDAVMKRLFDFGFIWADTNPMDESKFGSTTICGSLLQNIVEDIEEEASYKDFTNKFNETFNGIESPLRKKISDIENRVTELMKEQFAPASVKLIFNPIDIKVIFKNLKIKVDDGVETIIDEKGSGLQRSLIIALLEIYAEEMTNNYIKKKIHKPYFLFIDEPEICLHPKAQLKLLSALLTLSKSKQIFIATHSPFFFNNPNVKNSAIFILHKSTQGNNVEVIKFRKKLGLFPWSPSWGEITYFAYDNPTIEFHNELYGYLQSKSEKNYEKKFEEFLTKYGAKKTKIWQRDRGRNRKPYKVTLQTFIRNKIHHPDNEIMKNKNFTRKELKESIEEMIHIIKKKGYHNKKH